MILFLYNLVEILFKMGAEKCFVPILNIIFDR